MEKIDKELLQEFLVEVEENLQELEPNLLLLEKDCDNQTLLNDCFRNLHSIKGASGYMGFKKMCEAAHCLENLFDKVRQGSMSFQEESLDLVFDGVDLIKKLAMEIGKSGQEKSDVHGLISRSEEMLNDTGRTKAAPSDMPEQAHRASADDDSELMEIYADEMKGLFARLAEETTKTGCSFEEIKKILKDMERVTHYVGHDQMKPHISEALEIVKGADKPDAESWAEGRKIVEFLGDALENLLGITWRDLIKNETMGQEESCSEEDEELYQIFLDYAAEVAGPLACVPNAFSSEWATDCQNALEKLRTSARYMDYGDVVSILDEWGERLVELLSIQDVEQNYDPKRFQGLWQRLTELLPGMEKAGQKVEPGEPVQDARISAEEIAQGLDNAFEHMFEESGHGQTSAVAGDEKKDSSQARMADATRMTSHALSAPEKSKTGAGASTVRMDLNKVEELLGNVGELVVLRSGLAQVSEDIKNLYRQLQDKKLLNHKELKPFKYLMLRIGEQMSGLDRAVNKLQENVMSMRMLPVRHLFDRYPRMVRDLSKKLGKNVQLNIFGRETRLDKRLIEEIADPLMHIIRNAMDHGIESPEKRKKSGKPEAGTIDLSAFQDGNFVVISVRDDGQGLDREGLISKAVLQGLMDKEYARTLPDERVWELIFLPGVSTADEVSETSGRGVGMDVVRHNIEKIGGSINVQSTPGMGTKIELRIPLTLAIIKALLVQVGTQKLAIPLNSVQEAIRVKESDISSVEGFEIISLRQNTLPLIRLSKVFRGAYASGGKGKTFVVVVKHGELEAGLVVDRLAGQQEVVIKPLADYLTDQPGFAGASVLGDGSIALIIDLAAVLQRAKAFVARQRDFMEKAAIQEGISSITVH